AKRFRLYDAEVINSPRTTIQNGGANYRLAKSLYDSRQYKLQAFRCKIKPGEEKRMFLTLRASNSLQVAQLDGKKAQLTTSIKAVWVPRAYSFEEGRMVDNYQLKILSVHDPNRLRIVSPNGKASYVRRSPETFEVEIDFQNLGGRAAKRVELAVPWPRSLDEKTIQVVKRSPSKVECPECPKGPINGSTASCFELDTSRLERTGNVYFVYHNVLLHGKREPGVGGAKYTKGSVRFTARSTKQKQQRTPLSASIVFDGAEPVKTAAKSKGWRHKGLGLKIGYNFNFAPEGFDRFAEDFSQFYNIGLYYRRSSLVRGFTPFAGVEASMSGQAFTARSCTTDGIPGTLSYETLFLAREDVEIQSLDLQIMSELRFGGFMGLVVGVGPSIPLIANGNFTLNALESQDAVTINNPVGDFWFYGCEFIEDSDNTNIFDGLLASPHSEGPVVRSSSFGLLDGERGTNVFDQDVNSSSTIGAVGSIAAEFGSLNKVSLGIRQNFRIYPNSYREACVKFTNAEAYFRINLASL
ncbi:MAG: hypothetical protein AAFQ37_12545, partial [Bacteroidota bacterium]